MALPAGAAFGAPGTRVVVVRPEAAGPSPTAAAWCAAHDAALAGWAATTPALPLCGPGPDYGGSWAYVDLPGPDGTVAGGYFNATPGFQCVELAERYLSVAYGLSPVKAEGSSLAANYHRANPWTSLVVNGSPGAVGAAPVRGDVISFSTVSSFLDPGDGHVAVVVASHLDRATGDGTVTIAQENVAAAEMVRTLALVRWRLEDPTEPANAEWQYHDAEWLHVPVRRLDLRALVGADGGLQRGAPRLVSMERLVTRW